MTETTTAVAPFEGDMDPAERRHSLGLWKHAQQLSKSTLAGDLRGKPEDVYAVVAYADQFGINPGNAIQMIWIIKGRIVPRSEFLSAICRKNGHDIRFEESSSTRCTVAIRRRGDDFWSRVSFTIDDAKRAKLADKDIWKLFPADMLCHATVRRAVKRICPDVLLGVDLGGDEGVDAADFRPIVEAEPQKVVDLEVPFDDDEEIEDAEIIEGDEQLPPAANDDDRDKAMKRLMVACTKAFPETDAPKGTKTARQKLLRRAVQYVVLKEHRSAADLTTVELEQVETWIHRNLTSDDGVTKMTYDILDDGVVRFTLGDKSVEVSPPEQVEAA